MSEITIPTSALSAVGATNENEFFVKLAACIGKLQATVDAHAETLGNPATLTEARIREIATTAGSSEAAKALGATGVTPPAPPSAAAKVTTVRAKGADASRDFLREGKYKEAFESNAEWQAEFGDVKVFTAFMKAQRGGHIK